jgi:membrane dipeptidase
MEDAGEMIMIKDRAGLDAHINLWLNDEPNTHKPIGYILSLEGADSIVNISYLEKAYNNGLRAVGPAHYGPGRYANGTNATGHLTAQGIALLKEMDRLKMILDVTHFCDDAFWDALDIFQGHIWASHNNCRALVNHNRQFSDEMIKAIVSRGAVMGAALDAWMMVPGWVSGQSTPESMQCNLQRMIDHIDHVCQLAGNSRHIAIGTDLDGAYGKEQCPYDIETIADMQKLPELLTGRGYTQTDIENIMCNNWIQFLHKAWA